MQHRERRSLLRALWAIQEADDDAFAQLLLRERAKAPELSLVARFGSIDAMRDELESIIGFHEMQLGAHAADRGIRRCASELFLGAQHATSPRRIEL